MPVGIPALWEKQENGFFTRKYLLYPGTSMLELEFCLWLERQFEDFPIRHRYRWGGQIKLGKIRKYSLDAGNEEHKKGWQFFGCYFHKHGSNCFDLPTDKFTDEEIRSKRIEDDEMLEFFTKLGWSIQIVWACQYKRFIRAKDAEFKIYLKDTLYLPKSFSSKGCTQAKLLKWLEEDDEIFGYTNLNLVSC